MSGSVSSLFEALVWAAFGLFLMLGLIAVCFVTNQSGTR